MAIGDSFDGTCPICGNRHLHGRENVYREDGNSLWDYEKWFCEDCGATILVEQQKDWGTVIDGRGVEVHDWYDMFICPRCGNEADNYHDNEWFTDRGEDANYYFFKCNRCGNEWMGTELWNVEERRVFAVRDMFGRVSMDADILAEQGPYTKDYL
jgi:DNA-directed RNA polymerase subunit M/transcription elongation factor TFIIS